MRLHSAELRSYKRFAEPARIRLDESVVAVVGPNEAGKTSVLSALAHLNDPGEFRATGGMRELTRGVDNPSHPVVSALLELEKDDLDALGDLPRDQVPSSFSLEKYADGRLVGTTRPSLTRELAPRRRLLSDLGKLLDKDQLGKAVDLESLDEARDLAGSLVEVLGSEQQTLAPDVLQKLSDFSLRLKDDRPDRPAYVRDLRDTVRQVAQVEGEAHPQDQANSILMQRRPFFLQFDEPHRTLAPTYELNEVAADPPRALANLTALADLDLQGVLQEVNADDVGRIQELQDRSNSRLREVFGESWTQARIAVQLRFDHGTLNVLVNTEQGGWESVAQRSDGLLWFIALQAFTSTRTTGTRPVILLIDEAETHLHYDGQADLVRVFSRQKLASKVIYTTHSAGCLPEDLGGGIRMAVPIPGTGSSEIRNAFWDTGPGYSPLFLAMGASALAFTAMRRAVMAEGASELILLPALLREATERDVLGYQIAPGLAESNPEAMRNLDLEAIRVAHIVDSDDGGRSIEKRLLDAGTPAADIVRLEDGAEQGLSLEDMVEATVYADALNGELQLSHPGIALITAGDLPVKGRPRAVATWCAAQKVDPPNKRAVCVRILELGGGEPPESVAHRPLVEPARRALLRKVDEELQAKLQA